MAIERELGTHSVSINTDAVISTLEQPAYRPKIEFVYINLDTIVRNFFASMTALNQEHLDLDTSLTMLLDELRIIHDLVQINHVFYYQPVKEVKFAFPKATLKVARTEKQLMAAARLKIVMDHLVYELSTDKDNTVPGLYKGIVPFLIIGKKLPPRMVNTGVLTHHPHQILKRFDFPALYLLESRTGKVKSFDKFNTKLNGISEDDPIPFNEYTLQLIGDTALFVGVPSKLKKELRSIGQQRRWSSITSVSKFVHDLMTYGSKELKEAYGNITNVRI